MLVLRHFDLRRGCVYCSLKSWIYTVVVKHFKFGTEVFIYPTFIKERKEKKEIIRKVCISTYLYFYQTRKFLFIFIFIITTKSSYLPNKFISVIIYLQVVKKYPWKLKRNLNRLCCSIDLPLEKAKNWAILFKHYCNFRKSGFRVKVMCTKRNEFLVPSIIYWN